MLRRIDSISCFLPRAFFLKRPIHVRSGSAIGARHQTAFPSMIRYSTRMASPGSIFSSSQSSRGKVACLFAVNLIFVTPPPYELLYSKEGIHSTAAGRGGRRGRLRPRQGFAERGVAGMGLQTAAEDGGGRRLLSAEEGQFAEESIAPRR